jgi:hypothetical protein
LTIVEESIAYSSFEQDAQGRIDPDGWHNHGPIVGVRCVCARCKHKWKPRGATQAINLAGYPEGAL